MKRIVLIAGFESFNAGLYCKAADIAGSRVSDLDFKNIVGRMLEAYGRGFWDVSDEKLQKLREMYELTDKELKGVRV